jgi:hypothetical protein
MNPGDVVRCIDARYSEGRLVEGKMYVVSEVTGAFMVCINRAPDIAPSSVGVKVWGVKNKPPIPPSTESFWKSSRFVPVNRKDLEILSKVADKIMGGVK